MNTPASTEAKTDMEMEGVEAADPTANLDKEAIHTLTEFMGYSALRAQKGLFRGRGGMEGAVEWLLVHQDDDDIDEPFLSNVRNLELQADNTRHPGIEEFSERVKPLIAEEESEKIVEAGAGKTSAEAVAKNSENGK
jgi:hypothetical protein